jgi:hypothetical protein
MKNYDQKFFDDNPEIRKSYIMYMDANALYSWAMCQKMPNGDYKWVSIPLLNSQSDIDAWLDNLLSDLDGDLGYRLEVDTFLPDELHDLQSDYPCMPENLKLTEEMLSDVQRHYLKTNQENVSQIKKLVPNLLPKTKYVIHGKMLKQARELGWVITAAFTPPAQPASRAQSISPTLLTYLAADLALHR